MKRDVWTIPTVAAITLTAVSYGVAVAADPLRYGGDHRESTDQFWIDLLNEFGCRYVVMDTVIPGQRTTRANNMASMLYTDQPIWSYVRDKAVAA